MELSHFLAQLFGLTMIIFTITALVRPRLLDGAISDMKSSSLAVLMTGFVTVMGGLAVVLSHNIWEASWVGIVTFFGWAALLKGITFITFPNVLVSASDKVMGGSRRKTVLIIALLVSTYLAYKGFTY